MSRKSIHADKSKTGFGAEPQRGIGGQSTPLQNFLIILFASEDMQTGHSPFKFTFQVQLLLRSLPVYATFIKILNVHTHQYLYISMPIVGSDRVSHDIARDVTRMNRMEKYDVRGNWGSV